MLYLTALFLLITPLNTTDCSRVSSENASYDGQDLILSGHVVIDHILGKMQARKALLKRQEKSDFPFSQIELDQEVLILLKENGRLTADRAEFDLQKNQGILSASEQKNAIYQDMIYDKKAQLVPFTIAGRSLELKLLPKGEKDAKTDYLIDSICAEQNVAISYANAFFLTAAKATYNQLDLIDPWKGSISAYGQDANNSCLLTHEQDVVHARQIDINLIHSYLQLFYADGVLQSFLLPKAEKSPLHFSTTSLKWNDLDKKLLFKGPTQIEEQDLGTIHTQDELTITSCMVNDKMIFQTIDAKGHTIMTYKDLQGHNHRLESHGSLHIDQNKLQAWAESPRDQNGNTQNQLSYETEDLHVFSDTAQLDYMNIDQHIKPVSIILKEHIKLLSKDPNQQQLAIADKMSYSLDTHSIILSAYPGKKVLFWDALQELKISASEVHVTTDCLTQERVIKGIGKVQFAFSKEEETQFNQYFPKCSSHE